MIDEMKIAGFWRRAVALAIDTIITMPIISLLAALGGAWFQLAASTVLLSAYCAVGFCSRWQGTPGMKLMGVKIVNRQGAKLSAREAISWTVTSLLVTLVCMAPYLWLMSIVLQHISFDELIAMQRSGANPAAVLQSVADAEKIDMVTLGQWWVMASLGTLLLFVFWALTIAVSKRKQGIHNLIAHTIMVRG